MNMPSRPLAVVTGASTGIGLELARCCARNRYDLVVVADEPAIEDAAQTLRAEGVEVRALQSDLSTADGVDALVAAIGERPVDALLANAGRGYGGAFLDQSFDTVRRVIGLNVVGTLDLIQRVALQMRARGSGRILVTGSIAGLTPGSFQAVYNASKAFIDSFALALRNELKDTGVTVTCLMPGPTDTPFFERAGLEDTKMGQMKNKDDPADVAQVGFDAMLAGEADVVAGWKNKVQAAMSGVTPQTLLAEMHRRQAEPGSGST